ncbi:MAG: hypothetical protein GQ569_14585 [Methylococcaceae bacterium]|nr:hypothetical protein [Methylococcaceae bacterium]
MIKVILIFLLLILISIVFLVYEEDGIASSLIPLNRESRTVENVIEKYGVAANARLSPYFKKAKIAYPPKAVMLLALKQEKSLELWAKNQGDYTFIRRYPIAKLSGKAGPKLKEGDKQVPEGAYAITWLHPNSSYHLSMKLNYPNAFDLLHAVEEKREDVGSDIFIHGKAVSIGCLAMGDTIIEELFVLSTAVGIENIKVLIAPVDPRIHTLKYDKNTQAAWVKELYQMLHREFKPFVKKAM